MGKIICLDFDGVLHQYTTPWQAPDVIPDPPMPGAFKWLTELARDERFEVHIYSSRSTTKGGRMAMLLWFQDHGLPQDVREGLRFPEKKPPAWLTIDDRAVRFTGTWPSLDSLEAFVPWRVGQPPQLDGNESDLYSAELSARGIGEPDA